MNRQGFPFRQQFCSKFAQQQRFLCPGLLPVPAFVQTLTDSTGPAHGPADPNAIQAVMSYVPRLDFVFADFESPNRDEDVALMVQQVRSHPNSLINSAYIGNYAQMPGVLDESQHHLCGCSWRGKSVQPRYNQKAEYHVKSQKSQIHKISNIKD